TRCGYHVEAQLEIRRRRVRTQEWRHGRIPAVVLEDRVAFIIVHRSRYLSVTIAYAEDDVGANFAAILIQRVSILDRRFAPMVIAAHFDVTHASDRVRTTR